MDELPKKAISILLNKGVFEFVRRSCVYFVKTNPAERKRLLHGYYVKNWIECKNNRAMLSKVRSFKRNECDSKPLISVVIPTYNRAKLLTQRAIPSVLNQTYSNLEVIIVGDHCTDNTEELVRSIQDKRIIFYNLPRRSKYPKDPYGRWLISGSAPLNKALELAKGKWIAPLDDDDEFTPDHLEELLKSAIRSECEMVYGVAEMETSLRVWKKIGSFPPELGKICHMSVMFDARLRFLQYQTNCWRYLEPNDWNLWRRMREAGVRIFFVNKIVGRHHLERTSYNPRSIQSWKKRHSNHSNFASL
jgi:glycosyltransferase involved in cell wall biosynthesis